MPEECRIGRTRCARRPQDWPYPGGRAGAGADAEIAIFWSAPPRVFSTDVNYEYRQDSNLLYLTGIDQEDTILVLMPGNETRKEILFVRDADARREHWNGHSLTPSEASAAAASRPCMTGEPVRAVHRGVLLETADSRHRRPSDSRFFQALTEGRARLAVLLDLVTDFRRRRGAAQFVAKLRDGFFGFAVQDATPILAELRQIKSAYEQEVLRRSVDISSEAHRAGMRAARRQVRVRGRSRNRGGLSAQRRHELGIPLYRRQRSERDDSSLSEIKPQDGTRAICCWSMRPRIIRG